MTFYYKTVIVPGLLLNLMLINIINIIIIIIIKNDSHEMEEQPHKRIKW